MVSGHGVPRLQDTAISGGRVFRSFPGTQVSHTHSAQSQGWAECVPGAFSAWRWGTLVERQESQGGGGPRRRVSSPRPGGAHLEVGEDWLAMSRQSQELAWDLPVGVL